MGKVLARLRRISVDSFMGNILPGNVRIEFRNLMVRANDRVFEGTMPLKLSDIKPFTVPAFPRAIMRFPSFRNAIGERLFSRVSLPTESSSTTWEFFIHPDRARTRFPSFATLTSSPVGPIYSKSCLKPASTNLSTTHYRPNKRVRSSICTPRCRLKRWLPIPLHSRL